MPDDKRLDLSQNLDGLLGDIAAAAKEVKKQKDAEKVKHTSSAEKKQSKKIEMVIIAAAAVVIVFVAYFVVFSRPPSGTGTAEPSRVANLGAVTKGTPIHGIAVMPTASTAYPQPTTAPANRPVGGGSQVVRHGYGGAEQATSDESSPGM